MSVLSRRLLCVPAIYLLIAAMLSPLAAGAGERIEAARALFARFQNLQASFDPAVADLYAPHAVIYLSSPTESGRIQTFHVPADIYTGFLKQTMERARHRGDYNKYRDLEFTVEGRGVRIDGIRRSVWKGYEQPFSMYVEPNDEGEWRIVEEVQSLPERP